MRKFIWILAAFAATVACTDNGKLAGDDPHEER